MFLFMMILNILFTIAVFVSQIYLLKFFIKKLIVNDNNFNAEKFATIFEPTNETKYVNRMMITLTTGLGTCGTATALVLKNSELDRLLASLMYVDNVTEPRMTINLEGFKSIDLENIESVGSSKHIMSISFNIQATTHTDASMNLEDENIMFRQYIIKFNRADSLIDLQEV